MGAMYRLVETGEMKNPDAYLWKGGDENGVGSSVAATAPQKLQQLPQHWWLHPPCLLRACSGCSRCSSSYQFHQDDGTPEPPLGSQ